MEMGARHVVFLYFWLLFPPYYNKIALTWIQWNYSYSVLSPEILQNTHRDWFGSFQKHPRCRYPKCSFRFPKIIAKRKSTKSNAQQKTAFDSLPGTGYSNTCSGHFECVSSTPPYLSTHVAVLHSGSSILHFRSSISRSPFQFHRTGL